MFPIIDLYLDCKIYQWKFFKCAYQELLQLVLVLQLTIYQLIPPGFTLGGGGGDGVVYELLRVVAGRENFLLSLVYDPGIVVDLLLAAHETCTHFLAGETLITVERNCTLFTTCLDCIRMVSWSTKVLAEGRVSLWLRLEIYRDWEKGQSRYWNCLN